MSERLPRVTAADTIKAIQKIGFSFSRQSGSHKIYKNKKGNRITVPIHSGKILLPKTLISILKDAELSVEKFRELLK